MPSRLVHNDQDLLFRKGARQFGQIQAKGLRIDMGQEKEKVTSIQGRNAGIDIEVGVSRFHGDSGLYSLEGPTAANLRLEPEATLIKEKNLPVGMGHKLINVHSNFF